MALIPCSGRKSSWRTRWWSVVFFGRLAEDKGVDVLLKAMASVETLHVVGRGDQEIALRDLAVALSISERMDRMVQSRGTGQCGRWRGVVALPSWHELLGNVMAETMALGTPLVSTTSSPEVVGSYALPPSGPGDVDGLSTALSESSVPLLRVYLDLRMDGPGFGLSFTEEEVAAQFETVYAG